MKIKVVTMIVLSVACFLSAARGQTQYQPYEITFTATGSYTNPFDYNEVDFSVTFTGPGGVQKWVSGFWDGGSTWKVRFSPPISGSWSYLSSCSNTGDTGLNGVSGSFSAATAVTSGLAIYQHGGILKVNSIGRHLMYQDGTPFFYLADTWWGAPNYRMPFKVDEQNDAANIDTTITTNDAFSWAVDKRATQGFTVLQWHGSQGMDLSDIQRDKFDYVFSTLDNSGPADLAHWKRYDSYIQYANSKGFVVNLGIAVGNWLDGVTIDQLKQLYRLIYARYGAYAMINLITQEYNVRPNPTQARPMPAARATKLFALAAYLESIDAYDRVLGLHLIPDPLRNYVDPSWSQTWSDYMILQAGHFVSDQAKSYYWRYFLGLNLPMLESETNYEGFVSGNFICNPKVVRNSAYTAIQAGSFGFGYGASGSYSSAYNGAGQSASWGPIPDWWDSINNTDNAFDGATQMQWVRKCYELEDWTKLTPTVTAIPENFNLLVKSDEHRLFYIWYPDSVNVAAGIRLLGSAYSGAQYSVRWFNPITGNILTGTTITTGSAPGLILPSRPNPLSASSSVMTGSILGSTQDWMLILEYQGGGTLPPALPTTITPTVNWDFLSGTEGWTMATTTTNGAPAITSPSSLTIDATRNKVIKIKLKNETTSVHGIVSFTTTTTGETAFTADKRKVFRMVPLDSGQTEYVLDMYDIPKWTGTVNRIQVTLGDSALSGTTNGGNYNMNVEMVQVGSDAPSALTSEWTFDNNSNDVISGRNATLTGTTYSTDAIVGAYSLSLNGSTDFGSAGDVLDPDTGSYSLSLWFKRANTTPAAQAVTSRGNANSLGAGWSMFLGSDDRLYVRANGSDGATTYRAGQTGPVVGNTDWHHAVMTIDRTNQVILGYLDGVRTGWVNGGSGPTSNSLTGWGAIDTANAFRFGNAENSGISSVYFNGLLDDVRVYTDVLSANDVAALSGTKAYWRLDNNPVDSVGNDNLSLSAAGSSFTATAKVGTHSLLLDGTYGSAVANTSLDPASGSYTVFGWFKRSRIGSPPSVEMILCKGNQGSTAEGWSVWLDNSDNKILVRCNASNTSAERASRKGPVVSDTNWHSVALVIDRTGGVIKGYLDGSDTGWVAGGGGPTSDSIIGFGSIDSAENTVLGASMLSGVITLPFGGQIDDVRIYTRALSASEIATLANP